MTQTINQTNILEAAKDIFNNLCLESNEKHPINYLKTQLHNEKYTDLTTLNISKEVFLSVIDKITEDYIEREYHDMFSYMNLGGKDGKYDFDTFYNTDWISFNYHIQELLKNLVQIKIIDQIIKVQSSMRRTLEIRRYCRNINRLNFYGCGL
jgi:hypothetical protein